MTMVRAGKRHGYFWAHAPEGRLQRLVDQVPELVVGKVVAVTACDSGPLSLTPEEAADGWCRNGGIAWSPVIQRPAQLPIAGWDEWYVFDVAGELDSVEVFVNVSDFAPVPEDVTEDLEPTWDREHAAAVTEARRQRARRFWQQLRRLRPFAFVCEGQALSCVVRDRSLHRRVDAALSAPA